MSSIFNSVFRDPISVFKMSVIHILLGVTFVVINQAMGAPTGRCTLGLDFFNTLYNVTTEETPDFSVSGAVGFVGNVGELLDAVNEKKGNVTMAELLACLEIFMEPSSKPPNDPSPLGSSNLGYNRPGHLGGVQNIPVPKPPSSSFTYGTGYTTYQQALGIGRKFKDYQPNPYMMANSYQELLQLFFKDFLEEWNSIFDGRLVPKYWNVFPNQKKD